MDTDAVPGALAAALLGAGYRVRGPVGVGGGGPVWTAVRTDARGPHVPGRVVVHVVPAPDGDAGARLADRLAVLADLGHPHLPGVVDVVPVPAPAGPPAARPGPAATWAVLLDDVPGATVAALLAARGRLSAGEVVTLTVPVAGALDALHRHGLVHGDVSPANVVVRPDGCPVLIDVLGATPTGTAARGQPGTPGFTAPEVVAHRPADAGPGAPGPDGLPARAPADVFALGCVALAALDLSAHGGRLGDELRAACAPDPVRRPTAAELAAALYACAEPEPIAQPDAGVLARTALAQLAAPARTVSVASGGRHRAGRRRVARPRAVLAVAAFLAAAAVPAAGWVLAQGAAGADGAAGPPGTAAPGPGADGPSRSTGPRPPGSGVPPPGPDARPTAAAGPSPVPRGPLPGRPEPVVAAAPSPAPRDLALGRPDPVAAAVALTLRRAEVLDSGDPAGLLDVVRPGSPAHRTHAALLDRLARDGVDLDGLAAVVRRAERVDRVPRDGAVAAARGPSTVDVRLEAGLTAHTRRMPEGDSAVPATPTRPVVLRLAWTGAGWRVVEVDPR